jgi:hypothetical protein
MVRNRYPSTSRTLLAYRAIRETEVFLAEHLHLPHLRIPVIPVGHGRFVPELAEQFWSQMLAPDGTRAP